MPCYNKECPSMEKGDVCGADIFVEVNCTKRMGTDPENPRYKIGDRVLVRGWTSSDTGIIEDVAWIFHNRSGEYTWGYKCKYDNKGPALALIYVPQGYIIPAD